MNELPQEFLVGPCRVEPRELRLTRDGVVVRLEPRVMAVLACLVGRAGRTVSRDELLAQAWRGQVVSDDAINRAIWKLRTALSGDRSDASVIETVPRLGYRLLWPVGQIPAVATADTSVADAIAVAPDAAGVNDDDAVVATVDRSVSRPPHAWPWRAGLFLLAGVVIVVMLAARHETAPGSKTIRWRGLTHLPWAEYEPAFSPDGKRVVFAADADQGSQLWIQAVDSASAERLTQTMSSDHSPAWSPGSDRIAFVREGEGRCSIELIAVSGGTSRSISTCTADVWTHLDFSPDGRQLVVSDQSLAAGRPRALVIVDIESGTRRELTHPRELHGDFLPRWSPDGRFIAFGRNRGRGHYQILRVAAAGGEPEFILEQPAMVKWLGWRDSERLVFLTRHEGLPVLWQWQDGHIRSWMTLTDPDINAMALAPDGQLGALVREQRQRSVWRYANPRRNAHADREPRALLSSSREDYDAHYSPNGQRIAFTSTRNGQPALWLANADGTDARLLWGEPASQVIGIRWSSDSQHIVFERARGSRSDLCIVTLSATLSCLDTQVDISEMPSWSPDGDWLYYTAEHASTWSVWRIRRDGTSREQLLDDNAYAATVSRDGRQLFFARVGKNGLFAYDLSSRVIKPLIDDLPAIQPRAYVEGDDGIYYLGTDGQVFLHSWSDSRRVAIFRPSGIVRRATISLDPTQQFFILARDEKDRGDISLIDNLAEVFLR